MAQFDKDAVARAAAGRWRDIILSVCPGISADALSGVHERPCPKCGGSSRFRPWKDFDERGGLRCSHCNDSGNADGFSAVQWWHNCDFPEAIRKVAEHLRLEPAVGNVSGAAEPPPPQQVDWSAKWNRWTIGVGQQEDLLSQWCVVKRPIMPASVRAAEVMFGAWPKNSRDQACLGFYAFRDPQKPPVGLLLYRADGAEFGPIGKLKERKTHLVGGSVAGWIHVGGRDRTRSAEVVWRVEGLPDGLALLQLLPQNHAVVTPSNGCGWSQYGANNPPLDLFAGKVVIGVGDADAPGQRGLWRWAESVSGVADRLFLASLPFQLEETHGKDLRDWILAGADLQAIQSTLSDYGRLVADVDSLLDVSDQQLFPLSNYEEVDKQVIPRSISEVQSMLWSMTDRWPRRVGSRLFSHDSDTITWLDDAPALCAWFGLRTGANVDIRETAGLFSKKELFRSLQLSATEYKSVENVPHEPQMAGHYYTCGAYPDGDGTHLEWLLDRFCVDERADRDLILLLMATVFWGGGGGQRPAFMITANGTGAGKTTLASVVAELAGGMISVGQRDTMREITERMLTAEGRDKRILFVDNIKATRFSSAEIEALVTAPVISGRELYKGESQRPNTITWVMTMNGVGLSKDIADRVVVIRLKRPEYSGSWADETMSFVREFRREIICDVMAFLRGPKDELAAKTRWGAWTDGVLCRLALPEDAAALIHQRQRDSDVDGDEADMVQDYFRDRLLDLHYIPATSRVFIPTRIANQWHAAAINERPSATKSVQWLRTQIEQGAIKSLVFTRQQNRRGFIWQGSQTSEATEIMMDLEDQQENANYAKSER